MSNELLFEIGTEEIPAGFLLKAVGDMENIIHKSLTEKRIPFTGIKCMATPRRLVLYIAEVAPKQEDQSREHQETHRLPAECRHPQKSGAFRAEHEQHRVFTSDFVRYEAGKGPCEPVGKVVDRNGQCQQRQGEAEQPDHLLFDA